MTPRLIDQIPSGEEALLRIEELRDRAAPHELKYIDHELWLAGAQRRAARAGLLHGPKRQVLDLGCGAGWFAAWAVKLGHDCIGLDIPSRSEFFRELTNALDIAVIERAVTPFQELTGIGHWGLVTAFQITFNGHGGDRLWGPSEWAFLVDDLQNRSDAIHLELNRELDGSSVTDKIRIALEIMGCTVDAHIIRWSRDLG